jgi:hypothetical protein
MSDKQKQIDLIPEEFSSLDQAAEFWDTHDTTDYPDNFDNVATQSELKRRRYEIEIDEELMISLASLAQSRGVAISELVSDMLKEKIRPAA